MPRSHAPDGETFHPGPINLPNDGEVCNHSTMFYDAGASNGPVGKALDNAAAAYRREIRGRVTTDGASGITAAEGTGYTPTIVAASGSNGIRVTFTAPFDAAGDYNLVLTNTDADLLLHEVTAKDAGGFTVALYTVAPGSPADVVVADVDALAVELSFSARAYALETP